MEELIKMQATLQEILRSWQEDYSTPEKGKDKWRSDGMQTAMGIAIEQIELRIKELSK